MSSHCVGTHRFGDESRHILPFRRFRCGLILDVRNDQDKRNFTQPAHCARSQAREKITRIKPRRMNTRDHRCNIAFQHQALPRRFAVGFLDNIETIGKPLRQSRSDDSRAIDHQNSMPMSTTISGFFLNRPLIHIQCVSKFRNVKSGYCNSRTAACVEQNYTIYMFHTTQWMPQPGGSIRSTSRTQ